VLAITIIGPEERDTTLNGGTLECHTNNSFLEGEEERGAENGVAELLVERIL
jgi:hypothetical protein